MIVTSIRSSFLNTHDSCQQKSFIQYNLGEASPGNVAATKGSIVHKVLECLALGKQALQNNQKEFDAEELGILSVDVIDEIPTLLDMSILLYAEKEPQSVLSKKDIKDCADWTNNAITWQNGNYDPRNRHIVQPEEHFDFEIKEEWAKFNYKLADGDLSGYLRLTGTIDLVTIEDNQLSVVDWKTGSRLNFKTFKLKEHNDLEQEIQFLLYYYATSYIYPEYDSILFTVFFVKDGGPFTFLYSRDMLPEIERRIRKYFDDIRSVEVPKLEIGRQCSWCPYSKISIAMGDSPCAFYHQKTLEKGLYQVVSEFGRKDVFTKYSGGGRQITKE